MQRRTFLIALAALPAVAQVPPPEPWLGTWKLRLPNSDTNAGAPRYKRVTSRIEPWEGGLKVTYEMVGIRGGVTHMEWTGKFDGKDYPLQGVDAVTTHAYRRIDDRSYEIVIKNDGVLQSTARVVVPGDGKTLQVVTEGRNAGGQIVKSTAVYERQ